MKKHNSDCNICKFDENVLKQRARFVKTAGEAIQFAIDWQNWFSEQNKAGEEPTLYQSDLVEWQVILERLGKQFDLLEEFKENGIC